MESSEGSFSLKFNTQENAKKVKSAQQVGEQRISQTFGGSNTNEKGEADEMKRKREEYAVQLRKQKK